MWLSVDQFVKRSAGDSDTAKCGMVQNDNVVECRSVCGKVSR